MILVSRPVYAENEPGSDPLDDFRQLSLEEMLKVNVASLEQRTIKDSPSVITVITREDILNMGARDILDVLRRVPGFEIVTDIEGVANLGLRGNDLEGGAGLLMVDGVEINEPFYGATPLGHRIPIEDVQSIEIIRGPGSVIYGGHAEMAVINIITRSGADIEGASLAGRYGQMSKDYDLRDLTASGGHVFENGISFKASAFVGQGNRSDRTYTDVTGQSYDMAERNKLDPLFINVAGSFHGLNARFIQEQYSTTNQDGLYTILDHPEHKNFTSTLADLSYDLKISDKVSITPRLRYSRMTPWEETNPNNVDEFFSATAQRFNAQVIARYDYSPAARFAGGVEAGLDTAKINMPVQDAFYAETFSTYDRAAAFAEFSTDSWLINGVLGARYEYNNVWGSSFVPRAALTKSISWFHFKLMASESYRTPDIMALAESPSVRPEKATVLEAEVGAKILDNFAVRADAFDTIGSNAQVYVYDATTNKEGYVNGGRFGSKGLEFELRFQNKWLSAQANYSFYASNNTISSYQVPGQPQAALAFPQHKVVVSATANVWKGLAITPALIATSQRYTYTSVEEDGTPVLSALPAVYLLDLGVRYNNFLTKGLDVSLTGHNLLNSADLYAQAYNSLHAPIPGPSREVMLRASYLFSFL
jgi:outer membrane cobalamin receptor